MYNGKVKTLNCKTALLKWNLRISTVDSSTNFIFLRIHFNTVSVLCDTTPCHWIIRTRHRGNVVRSASKDAMSERNWVLLLLKIRTVGCVETSSSDYLPTPSYTRRKKFSATAPWNHHNSKTLTHIHLRHFKFSEPCCWRFISFVMLGHVEW